MEEGLLRYYERELSHIRNLAAEFAERYPKIASRLQLEQGRCEDPHVERLLEGFALLAGRVHRKIDDDLPELTSGLLGYLYPHLASPIPSCAIAQFVLDPDQGKLTTAYRLERGTALFTRPVDGAPCRFRTAFATDLWPIRLQSAEILPIQHARLENAPRNARAVLRLRLELLDEEGFRAVCPDALTFYLNGESTLTAGLYEQIFREVVRVELRAGDSTQGVPVTLPNASIQPVGFGRDEALLDAPKRSLWGYGLLQEYFVLPEKFLFFRIEGLRAMVRTGARRVCDVLLYLESFEDYPQTVDASNFLLGCTPIVNLFERSAEPIRLDHSRHEYRIIADVHRQNSMEVYSIDSVIAANPRLARHRRFEPLYGMRHSFAGDEEFGGYFDFVRRPSQRKGDKGTEVFLMVVDQDFHTTAPAEETLSLKVTCTNRDLPEMLPFGGGQGDFEVEQAAPLKRITALTKPTATLRPPVGRGSQWRLVSHLSMNYLSIVEGGADALREILALYNVRDSPAVAQLIQAVQDVHARRVFRRIGTGVDGAYCRGSEVTITVDERSFVGASLYLFGAVLETFLGLTTSVNSFVETVLRTPQGEEEYSRWAPRVGERRLL